MAEQKAWPRARLLGLGEAAPRELQTFDPTHDFDHFRPFPFDPFSPSFAWSFGAKEFNKEWDEFVAACAEEESYSGGFVVKAFDN